MFYDPNTGPRTSDGIFCLVGAQSVPKSRRGVWGDWVVGFRGPRHPALPIQALPPSSRLLDSVSPSVQSRKMVLWEAGRTLASLLESLRCTLSPSHAACPQNDIRTDWAPTEQPGAEKHLHTDLGLPPLLSLPWAKNCHLFHSK